MDSTIKPGDMVTWRERPHSLGIANCKVIRLGTAEDTGEPAALVEFTICGETHKMGARLKDLNKN